MAFIDSLISDNRAEWTAYIEHDFVTQLGTGSLPLAAFQDYLVQDYLFLIQFARANALAAYKSRSLTDLNLAHASLGSILAETELHIQLTERWGISRSELEASPEKNGTVAYTRYVLDVGASGDLLDLAIALAPCTIGYAVIGSRLAPSLENAEDHPYREWIATYAGTDFQDAARAASAHADVLAERALTDARRAELSTIFRTAVNLETDFWQQALDAPTVIF